MILDNFHFQPHQTLYCERGQSTTLLAEPINAVTNLAFLFFGWLAYRLVQKTDHSSKLLSSLPLLLSIVGIGSFIYHTDRNATTLLFDAVPIYVFMLTSLFLLLTKILRDHRKSLLVLMSFIVVEVLLTIVVPRDFLNNSIRHIIAVCFMTILSFFLHQKYGPKILVTMLSVIALYATAIVFRSVDLLVCQAFFTGTHFLWHLLAAVAGYQAIKLLCAIESE